MSPIAELTCQDCEHYQCHTCGDGYLYALNEECDLGTENGVPGSGCLVDCAVDTGLIEIYWALDAAGNNRIFYPDPINMGTEVWMILKNDLTLPAGDATFEIFEEDTFPNPDDLINTTDQDIAITNASWEVNMDDLANGIGLGDASVEEMEIYFTVNGRASEYLNVTNVVETECLSSCGMYTTPTECDNDGNICDIADEDVEGKTEGVTCGSSWVGGDGCEMSTSCACYWNETREICDSEYETGPVDTDCLGGGTPDFDIGNCFFDQLDMDNCDDGFISSSWGSNWVWGTGNDFGTDDPATGGTPDAPYTGESYIWNGTNWVYDPIDPFTDTHESEKCAGGSSTVPCPAQVQLPFFGLYSVIITIILILGIYVGLANKEKI